MFWSRKPKWNPAAKHCIVTGGSSGLGLAFATLLVKNGAHVAIIARDKDKLAKAIEQLEAARVNPSQIITSHSFSLSSLAEATEAIKSACTPFDGRAPDALFTCAGVATPGYFIEETEESMLRGMQNAYWIQAWPALATSRLIAAQGHQNTRIVFVGSTLGYMSFVGYASYSPAKHALVGLTETLRSELALYGATVQLFVPCTMFSPGYENENKSKPAITKKIEETDGGLTPEQAAVRMLKGVQSNNAHFTADIITEFFRVSTRGSAPNNNVFIDALFYLIAWPGVPIWRYSTEKEVRNGREAHLAEMRAKGLVKDPSKS